MGHVGVAVLQSGQITSDMNFNSNIYGMISARDLMESADSSSEVRHENIISNFLMKCEDSPSPLAPL